MSLLVKVVIDLSLYYVSYIVNTVFIYLPGLITQMCVKLFTPTKPKM